MLQAGYSAEPGAWRTSRTPYLQAVMDAFADPTYEWIFFVSSARVGKTESVNNMLGYAIDQQPGPVLYVYPTEHDAKEECKKRIARFIEDSPKLAEHITSAGWETLTELTLGSLTIYMAWAGSQSTLIRRTIRYVFVDEIDNCDAQSGMLGDTLALAAKRTVTFGRRAKVVVVSTPTTPHGAAWRNYEKSDRQQYYVPCPECGVYQVLVFDNLKVPEDQHDPDTIVFEDLAYYECRHCKAHLRNSQKQWMVERGVWLKAGESPMEALPVDDPQIVARARFNHPDRWTPQRSGTAKRNLAAGFHIWAAYSPWVTWSQIMAEWFKVKDEPEELRTFVNSVLGEPFKDAVDEAEPELLQAKRERGAPRDIVPVGVQVLVAGADVQQDHVYYIIRGWGYNRESWLIRHGVCETLADLYMICTSQFRRADGGQAMAPAFLAVDSGYDTLAVYDLAKSYDGVYPVKGTDTATFTVRPSKIEYTPRGKRKPTSVTLYHVSTPHYKERLFRFINADEDDDLAVGRWHLNREVTDDYCAQLTSEHRVWVTTQGSQKRRKLVWQPKRAHLPNHYLDAEVYAMAIADFRGVLNLRPEAAQTQRRKTSGRQMPGMPSMPSMPALPGTSR